MESLAVKYRPTTFLQVVGQENIKKILENQLKTGNTKQGYLFCGGAGTGKTTTARILAKEINKGKGEPIEIDAASNNGVEHVREIRDKVKYKPLDSEYKVYIIDEVHMLSQGAFNALLKTLEEPPAHAVFMLCTTDPQKIPPTILSRVQRFDFKRIPLQQVVERLKSVITYEKEEEYKRSGAMDAPYMEIEDEVFEYIAKLADGGMRDALSLLDTCLSYETELTLDHVFEILGTPSIDTFADLLDSVYTGNSQGVIAIIEKEHLDGKDLKMFVRQLTSFIVELQKLLLFRSMEFVKLPTIYEDGMKSLVNIINRETGDVNGELNQLFDKFSELSTKIKYEQNPKVLVEGVLLKLCWDKKH